MVKPKFNDTLTWQQAEFLMQPVFIRLIDNLRKQLDESDWKGTYQDVLIWPEGTPEATKAETIKLQKQLESAPPKRAAELEEALAKLPSPYPSYQLCLEHQGQQTSVDLWDLCYQICFRNYDTSPEAPTDQPIEVDLDLLDETGDVDWHKLDAKAKHLVEQLFANLPVA